MGRGASPKSLENFQRESFPCNIMSKKVSSRMQENSPPSRWRRAAPVSASGDAAELYAQDGSRKYLNANERRRVLAALDALPVDQALFVRTLLWSGARVSEVLALTSASFQIERGVVAIRTLKRRRHAMREVPLPFPLLAALDARFGLTQAKAAGGLRPASSTPLWCWCRQTAWRVVRRVMDQSGISGRAGTPRGLRHAFGIAAVQADVPLDLVSRWMGHSRLATTAIYTAASGPEERALAERFWLMAA
jgi:integrase/recombinase XerD